MANNNDFNEKELDDFMNSIDKKEIKVPDKLENKIVNKINSARKKTYLVPKILASCISILLVFTASIKISPQFASYASSVSFLKPFVDWIKGTDKGIQVAYENGYQKLPQITHEEDGYTITIDNIFIDIDRFWMTIEIKGDKINDILETYDNPNIYYYINDLRADMTSAHFGYKNDKYDEDSFIRDFEITFHSPESFDYFIGTNWERIPLFISIRDDSKDTFQSKDIIQNFEKIEIPINRDYIKESKIFYQGKELSFKNMDIQLTDFVINPTRMRVNFDVEYKPGYYLERFKNVYLKDSNGNVYGQEGTSSSFILDSRSEKYKEGVLYFVPSIYFEDQPKEIYLCIDGMYYMKEEEKEVTLSLSDEYPKVKKIGGNSIIFYKPTRDDNGNLVVEYDTSTDLHYFNSEEKPPENREYFSPDEIYAKNCYYLILPDVNSEATWEITGGKRIGDTEYISRKYVIETYERDSYKFFIGGSGDYTGYLDDTKIEIKLEMEQD